MVLGGLGSVLPLSSLAGLDGCCDGLTFGELFFLFIYKYL